MAEHLVVSGYIEESKEKWKTVKVGSIGKIITGKTPKTTVTENYGGIVPFLTPSDDMDAKYVSKTSRTLSVIGVQMVKNFLLPANSVCVSCIGSDLGKVVITTEPTVTNQQINSIIVDTECFDVSFVYYAMVILGKHLNVISKASTTVPIVNKSRFSDYEIVCPPLQIQKKVASILSVLDEKIALNNQINDNLEQQASALVEQYFESVSSIVPFAEIMSFENGFAFKSSTYLPSGQYRIITIKNVQDGQIDTTGAACIDELPQRMKEGCVLQIGDALLSLTGNVGRVGIVCENGLLLNQRVAKIVPHRKELLPLLYFIYRQPSTKTQLESIAKGTAQLNLSPVETLKLTVPYNSEVALDLSHTLTPIYQAIITNNQQSINLASMRDALLPKLMSGEIDVTGIGI